MSSDEAKRIVSAGLEQRKAKRLEVERESRLEQYEQDMIATCNERCADAKIFRMADDAGRIPKEQAQIRRAARMKAKTEDREREEAATDAVKRYIIACAAILLTTAWTNLPLWAAVTLDLGIVVFPAAYIFRLYFPADKAG